MADLSIRERIIRQAGRNIEAVSGLGTCYRWDSRGFYYDLDGNKAESLANLDFIVGELEEVIVDHWSANVVRRKLTWSAAPQFVHGEDSTKSTHNQRNLWQSEVYKGIMATQALRQMTEDDTSVPLAYETEFMSWGPTDVDGGLSDISATFETYYYHDFDNPGTYLSAIALLTE